MSELRLIDYIEKLRGIQPESIARREALGDVNFSDAVNYIEEIKNLFQHVTEKNILIIPPFVQESILSHAKNFSEKINDTRAFKLDQPNPIEARNALLANLTKAYKNFYNSSLLVVSYLNSYQIDHDQNVKVAEERIATLEKKLKEADAIVSNIKDAAAKQGVSSQAIHFYDEAKTHKETAAQWQQALVWMLVIVVILAVLSLIAIKIKFFALDSTFEMVQFTMAKALIFAALAYMTAVCAKNFASHKHNEVVNRHRHNALLVFNVLVDAAKDDSRKDVILNHAAACIFAPQDTGYTKSSTGSDTPVKFVGIETKFSNPTSSS